MYIPKIGNRFYFDGVNWIVVGVGNTPFEYRADKGIFAIVDLNKMDCLLVIIKDKEVKISIDPSIPSVRADDNELLKIYGDKGTYALLEFDEKNN
ncbi:MAG: hypothetical protein EU535_03495 [Promethearchaeota archaeon]|nr:MAG: hypothetical protein EU535_03495 [Candidatus Lokiarchaeota archaeon]